VPLAASAMSLSEAAEACQLAFPIFENLITQIKK
jgi:hypothetical protein